MTHDDSAGEKTATDVEWKPASRIGSGERSLSVRITPVSTADRHGSGADSSEGAGSTADTRTDESVLVPVNDYRPGTSFCIVGRLPAPITIALLSLPCGERVGVLTRPDAYTGYVVRSTTDDRQVEATTTVFVEGSLDLEASYTFTADTRVFSTRLKLFESVVTKT